MAVDTTDKVNESYPIGRSTSVQTALEHGSKASIGTTAVQLTTSSIPANNGVLIKASDNNAGVVYVGNSDVTASVAAPTTDGFPLNAGDSIFIEIDYADKIYLRADTASQVVSFIVT